MGNGATEIVALLLSRLAFTDNTQKTGFQAKGTSDW